MTLYEDVAILMTIAGVLTLILLSYNHWLNRRLKRMEGAEVIGKKEEAKVEAPQEEQQQQLTWGDLSRSEYILMNELRKEMQIGFGLIMQKLEEKKVKK